jgi:hypothetical protein
MRRSRDHTGMARSRASRRSRRIGCDRRSTGHHRKEHSYRWKSMRSRPRSRRRMRTPSGTRRSRRRTGNTARRHGWRTLPDRRTPSSWRRPQRSSACRKPTLRRGTCKPPSSHRRTRRRIRRRRHRTGHDCRGAHPGWACTCPRYRSSRMPHTDCRSHGRSRTRRCRSPSRTARRPSSSDPRASAARKRPGSDPDRRSCPSCSRSRWRRDRRRRR